VEAIAGANDAAGEYRHGGHEIWVGLRAQGTRGTARFSVLQCGGAGRQEGCELGVDGDAGIRPRAEAGKGGGEGENQAERVDEKEAGLMVNVEGVETLLAKLDRD